MVKLDPRLEKRLDNYAILYCFYHSPNKADSQVLKLARRIYGLNRKKRYELHLYYQKQKATCESVKRSLESFAASYEDMNPKERENHDQVARDFIFGIFPEDRENVFYLIDYYNLMKSDLRV